MKRLFWRSEKYSLEEDSTGRNGSYDMGKTPIKPVDFRPYSQSLNDLEFNDLRLDDLELNDLGSISMGSSDFDNNHVDSYTSLTTPQRSNRAAKVKQEKKRTNLTKPKVKGGKRGRKVKDKLRVNTSTGSLMIGGLGLKVTVAPQMYDRTYQSQHHLDDETGSVILDFPEVG